ncbi:IPExxxVDY family protein [Tamlana sp. 2_MG-2023]|uniref:IPExxxVDY family protein n=1 Tax=unclassified Tamlana TaxID=2614803 RepID=UPI0026E48924|nr:MULTISPECIES: IPExxxVDY family protein [unclassified Tamlana]MDO6761113.1 IPExxxVDY family protein [Tamlana sp. 2_MG-2023]MDO6791554.1 IPExxxVDY family protein [Tamlana sp. 1_MG-2023]
MAVQKFVLDDAFEETAYTLIGIHCRLEDYRLAYLINQSLGITLKRRKEDLDYSNSQAKYSIYQWEDEKQLITWSLVSNICKIEAFQSRNFETLFDTQEKIIKTFHLLPEYKTVNFLLKIESEFSSSKTKYILDHILKIPQIATAYSIDSSILKSKDNLIFN